VFAQRLGQVGDAAFEFRHGAFELALVGFVVGEEAVQKTGDLYGLVESELAGLTPVLVEDGDARIFEDGVAGGVIRL
jgi:hypothetical protein